MTSTLTLTKGSHRVSLDVLRNLPDPEAMGARHKPIPHWHLVDTLVDQIDRRGWSVVKSNYAVARGGATLFGVMDLRDTGAPTGAGTGISFGFRSSTNQITAIKGVAGFRVFNCDNLTLSGDMFVLHSKLTTRLNLPFAISNGLNKFLAQADVLCKDIFSMEMHDLTPGEAKERCFDVFDRGALPLHLFDDVSQLYFHPQREHPDCQPRTMWGLHNACTRAVKSLSPAAQFNAAVSLGTAFKEAS